MAKVKDPVCGMMIDDQQAAAQSDYEGTHVYFCSAACKAKFDDDPRKYVTATW